MELKKVLDEISTCEKVLETIENLSYLRHDDSFYLANHKINGKLSLDLPTVLTLIEAKEKSLSERLSQLKEAKKLAEKVIYGLLNN
jgi:hypothetical protein